MMIPKTTEMMSTTMKIHPTEVYRITVWSGDEGLLLLRVGAVVTV
jgi:hypothetical protein